MTYKRMTWASGMVAVALAMVATAALWRLPPGAELPTHWNAAGEVDRTDPASFALFLPVMVTLGLSSLCLALPRLEPLQHRLERSAALLLAAWAGLLALMALTEAIIAAPAFGLRLPPALAMAGSGVLLIVIGNALPKSRPGFFVGIRTPWAILEADNWIATHRLGAWTFIAGGLLIVAAALLPVPSAIRAAAVTVALAGAVVPPVILSWWLWRGGAPRADRFGRG